MTEIAVRANADELAPLNREAQESAVTLYLSHARDQLARAVEATGPAAVAALKAEIATAAEATKQLGLSKEIQADALEMVRRAEYALGKAIRAGQERGEVRTKMSNLRNVEGVEEAFDKPSPQDFATKAELSGNGVTNAGIYALVDGVSAEQFESALIEARAEGNLTKTNLLRKIQGAKNSTLTTAQKLERIAEMAEKGHSSDQIAKALGHGEDYIRRLAKENGVTIAADRLLRGTRRINHTSAVEGTVIALEGLASGLDAIDPKQVDQAQIEDWAASMKTSIAALNGLRNALLKEMTQ